MSASDGISIYHGNHRLGKAPDLALHIQHIKSGYTILSHITCKTLHILISPAAESCISLTG